MAFTDTENKLMDSVTVVGGRSVWDEWRHIYGNTYTTVYKIDSQIRARREHGGLGWGRKWEAV